MSALLKILNKSLEQLSQPQKGLMAKIASTQSEQALGQLRMQLAAAYFNNATIYFQFERSQTGQRKLQASSRKRQEVS